MPINYIILIGTDIRQCVRHRQSTKPTRALVRVCLWIITNFLFRTLLSASLKLNTEGSLVSLGTSIPAIQFYAANRFASRLVAGTKLYQVLPTILRKGCSQHRKHSLSWRFLGLSLDKRRRNTATSFSVPRGCQSSTVS